MSHAALKSSILLGLVVASAAVLVAGPLAPPAGPIASTYPTLSEIEPRIAINATNTPGDADSLFKITLPGSYYLTDNLQGVAGKHGIEIASSGVTLDLMGFDLLGVPQSLDGVSVTVSNLTNIAVFNGSVRQWGEDGIDIEGVSTANGCRVADVNSSGNAGNGISIGHSGTVVSCSAYQNGADGVTAFTGCTLLRCSVRDNDGDGIVAGTGSTITNCSSNENGGVGISGGSVTDCSAGNNGGHGIDTPYSSTVTNCRAFRNGGNGIDISGGSSASNCSAYANTGNGINTSAGGCTVTDCRAYQNLAHGISAGTGSTVADSTAELNSLDGIRCDYYCVIRGNSCTANGYAGAGAGVHVTGWDNRIENNRCSTADIGIDVDGVGNIIIRNTCADNTVNWTVVANNSIAPIVFASVSAMAVSGNTYSGGLGSTDPNANFTY